jgi:hypothetical protein
MFPGVSGREGLRAHRGQQELPRSLPESGLLPSRRCPPGGARIPQATSLRPRVSSPKATPSRALRIARPGLQLAGGGRLQACGHGSLRPRPLQVGLFVPRGPGSSWPVGAGCKPAATGLFAQGRSKSGSSYREARVPVGRWGQAASLRPRVSSPKATPSRALRTARPGFQLAGGGRLAACPNPGCCQAADALPVEPGFRRLQACGHGSFSKHRPSEDRTRGWRRRRGPWGGHTKRGGAHRLRWAPLSRLISDRQVAASPGAPWLHPRLAEAAGAMDGPAAGTIRTARSRRSHRRTGRTR